MHAFIISNKNHPELEILNQLDTLEITPETSVGIEEVRTIHQFLSRKPTQSDQNTIVINSAHLLTIPAQNALLKTLEEPPSNSRIYLITEYPDQLLPTVLSRVQIDKTSKNPGYGVKKLEKVKNIFDQLVNGRVGERLKIIDGLAFTRESALEFLTGLEHLTHKDLSLARYYSQVVETRKYLKANCSVRLSLDNLVLGL